MNKIINIPLTRGTAINLGSFTGYKLLLKLKFDIALGKGQVSFKIFYDDIASTDTITIPPTASWTFDSIPNNNDVFILVDDVNANNEILEIHLSK